MALIVNPIKEAFPYLYIDLNGVQEQFINMHAFINIFSAANKVGKTAVGVNKLIRAMKENKVRARVVSDPTLIEAMVVPEILKWLGQEAKAWDIQKKGRLFESWFRAPNGSVCDVMTYEQSPKEFEGVPLDFLLLDEPPPQGIWGACTSRFLTDNPNSEINITMTPLRGAAWIYDELITKADGKHISYLYADIEDNCKQHGVRGRLDHERIQEIMSDYDPDEREAREHGQFMFLSGKVYKCFDSQIHIIEPFEIPENVNFYHVNDPHDRRYPALSWIFLTPDETAFVYDEWPTEPFEHLKSCPYDIEEMKEIIKDREEGREFIRIMDPLFGAKPSAHTRRTTQSQYWKSGLKYRLGSNNMDLGHKAVRHMLKSKKLFFFRNCRNHWHFMDRYSWKDWKGKAAEEKSISENISEKYKDFADNVRYFALSYPNFKHPLPEKQEKPEEDTHKVGHRKILEAIGAVERQNDIRSLV